MLRYHLRTLFGSWHLLVLAGVLLTALLWPAASAGDRLVLRWFLTRTEVYGPLVLMGLTSGLLLVDGRLDERWGAVPPGFGGLFLQRWGLVTAYYGVALGLFVAVGGARAGEFAEGRAFASALVTAALFSQAGALLSHVTGSFRAGWTGGLALYFISVAVAMFWCPKDSTYQLWLPFAGLSDAGPLALALSKGSYSLAALLMLWLNQRLLIRPERIIRRAD